MNIQRTPLAKAHPDATWARVFDQLDREGQGLNIQIRRAIVRAIETGLLASCDRLPSSRQLASFLGVARNTVTTAYQLLIDEGFLASRERSGISVALRAPVIKTFADKTKRDESWTERFAVHPSKLRHFNKPRDWLNYPYPFLYGQFDAAIFPSNNWREAVRVTSSVQEISGWGGDMIDDDDPDLIEQLRVHVLPQRGVFASPEEIIVTIGSQQALSMLVQLFAGPNTNVGIENPGYPDIRNMAQMTTGGYTTLNSDEKGVLPDNTFAACDMVFLTVGHQCPTTWVTPPERRQALLSAAAVHNVIVVEDDYEADLNFGGADDPAPMKSVDPSGRVIYVGSFSKALAPGLRIGYIVAPPLVIEELRVLRRLLMRHPPTNNQRVLATFIGLGHYRLHLNRLSEVLARRSELIARCLPKYLPQCRFGRVPGAKSFWIELPEGINCRDFETRARENGVLIEAGDIFFADPSDGERFLRLGFTAITETHIEPGLRILGDLLRLAS